jgi:integrase/recombinase XerD
MKTLKELPALAESFGLKSSVHLLESFYLRCRMLNLTPVSLQDNADRLSYLLKYAHLRNLELDALTPQDLQTHLLSIVDINSPMTVNGRITVYKTFFKYLYEEGLISTNPAGSLRKLKVPLKLRKTVAPEEMAKVLMACDRKTFYGDRDFCMMLLTYDSMLRLSELLALKLSDLDLQGRLVKLFGKGRKERYAPFSSKTARALHLYLVKHRPRITGDLLFPMRDGNRICAHQGHRIFMRAGKAVGVKLHPHLLRHSGASEYIKQGGNVAVLSRILGHASLSTTQIYLHLSGADLLNDFERLSPTGSLKI